MGDAKELTKAISEEMIEEAAWQVILYKRWVASPELLFALKDIIRTKVLPSELFAELNIPDGSA